MAAPPNRRLTVRTTCQLTVRYRAGAAGEEWRPATAMDLSRFGCRLRLGEDLPRGATVAITLESKTSGEVAVAGTVIWTRREGLSWQAGIQFAETSPAFEALLVQLG